MFLRILKKDLKRKKTMNIILFLFIVLSATFVSSGINNVVTVINGIDYYLDKAGLGDYVIITMGENSVGILDDMLKSEPKVTDYRMEVVVYGAQDNITAKDGSKLESENTSMFQSIDDSAIKFFDKDNKEITHVENGHVFVSGDFMEKNNLSVGDVICLSHSGVEMSFVLAGTAKDALLSSDFMRNSRFIMNDEDMQILLENEEINQYYRGEICYIDTDDTRALSSSLAHVSNIAFDGGRSTIKMCYVMEMILAFIMLLLSVCLIIVSFVVLKFSITFTIMEEFREIGVMKAIGLSNGKIRSLYIIKYLIMALLGSAIGFFVSIPFGNMMLDSVSRKMVLGNDHAVLVNLLGSFTVIIVILLFAYLCTGKVKISSPIDAIRCGQTGERYKSKSVIRIHRCPIGNALFMAINDFLSSPKRFASIIFSFCLCMLFVLILVNTTATMKSPNLIYNFGTKSDLYMTDVSDVMNYMNSGSPKEIKKHLDDMEMQLAKEGMAAQLCIELQYKFPITFEGKDYMITCQQGMDTKMSEYQFTQGDVPKNKNEIAITPQISQMIGAGIGDKLTIHYGDRDEECMVTAYFQTMNQLGEIMRLHEDAPTDFAYISSAMSYQINFTDNPSDDEIEVRKEKIKDLYNNDKVMNATEYCIDCTSVSGSLESLQFLLLGITLVVVILMVILIERNFIADEKSQIAILKAIGFKDNVIIWWHVYRFGIAALIAVILAAVLSIPMTNICITPIFGMMGAADVEFNIRPLQIFVVYPCIILIVTILMTWITAIYTKTIKSSDTANIE